MATEETRGGPVETIGVIALRASQSLTAIPPSSPTITEREDAEERAALVHLVRQQLPTKVRHASFANFDPKPDAAALRLTQQWVSAAERWYRAGKPDNGPSLLLTSERQGEVAAFGNGKSHLAAAALLALAERGAGRIYRYEGGRGDNLPSIMFITSADLIALIRTTYGRGSETTAEQIVSRFAWADFLALDDIGTEGAGDDVTPHMFRLLERRAGKPTIYTSNYGRKMLAERSPEWGKLTSRMAAHLKGAVLRGPDRREAVSGVDPWGDWV